MKKLFNKGDKLEILSRSVCEYSLYESINYPSEKPVLYLEKGDVVTFVKRLSNFVIGDMYRVQKGGVDYDIAVNKFIAKKIESNIR